MKGLEIMSRKMVILGFVLMLWLPTKVKAQFSFDVPVVEAMIADHKEVNSLHMARATIEHANMLLHQYSRKAADEHLNVNVDLDKYSKCFDLIDIIIKSGSTAMNVYNTYDDVSSKLSGYQQLIDRYYRLCLKKGDIYSSDTLIINNLSRTVASLCVEGKYIFGDMVTLTALCAASKIHAESKTQTYIESVDDINRSLDHIREIVNAAYFQLWLYIMQRTGYWKAEFYEAKNLHEIATDAISSWLDNAKSVKVTGSGGVVK
jgi:hypothetical protein